MSSDSAANPVLVEVTRGGALESRHRGAAVVADGDGTVIAAWGDIEAPVFPRSAVKVLQAVALVESGAAEAFGVSDEELALASASHNAESGHTDRVRAWLRRLGLDEGDLACGAHWPLDQDAAHGLARAGLAPGNLHNNCSGKHAGFLTLARHLGVDPAGYEKPGHPVQQRVLGVFEEMCGLDLGGAVRGIDGCGVPTWAMPLANIARGMARVAAPASLPAARAAALTRLFGAITAHPYLVAGRGRFCTALMEAAEGRLLAKTGAEGVYCAAAPGHGLGVAVKCDDGAARAAEVIMAAVLAHVGILSQADIGRLGGRDRPQLINRAGTPVGEIRSVLPL